MDESVSVKDAIQRYLRSGWMGGRNEGTSLIHCVIPLHSHNLVVVYCYFAEEEKGRAIQFTSPDNVRAALLNHPVEEF